MVLWLPCLLYIINLCKWLLVRWAGNFSVFSVLRVLTAKLGYCFLKCIHWLWSIWLKDVLEYYCSHNIDFSLKLSVCLLLILMGGSGVGMLGGPIQF